MTSSLATATGRPSHDAPSASAADRRRAASALAFILFLAVFALAACASTTTPPAAHEALDEAVTRAARDLVDDLARHPDGAASRRVAVVPPREAPAAWADLATGLRHRVGDRLRALAPGLVLVEREDLDAVWHEHRLGASGVVDPGSAARLGRLLGADAVVVTRLGEIDGTPQLDLSLIDVGTSVVLGEAVQAVRLRRPRLPAPSSPAGDGDGGPGAEDEEPTAAAAEAPLRRRPAVPPQPGKPVVGDFRLVLAGCGFGVEGGTVVCRLTAKNVAPGPRTLTFLGSTRIFDTGGGDYRLQQVRIGTRLLDVESETTAAAHEVAGGLQATIELAFSEMPRRKKKIQCLDLHFAEGTTAFGDITLSRE